jgi:MFS family permease
LAKTRKSRVATRCLITFPRAVIAALRAGSVATVVGVIIAANGGTEPTMGTRSDEIAHLLGIGLAGLGVALGSISVSMWVTSTFAGALVDSLGTRKVLRLGACACWVGFGSIGFVLKVGIVTLPLLDVAVPLALIGAQFVVGVGFALLDVALYRVSTWYEAEQAKEGGNGRLLNQVTFAWYSVGSLLGSGVGYAAAVWLKAPVPWHLAAWGLGALAATMLYAIPRAPDLKGGERRGRLPRENLPELRRAALVGMAAVFAVALGFNWSAIVLASEGAKPVIAALGPIAFNASTILSRVIVVRVSARGIKRPVQLVRVCGLGAVAAIALISGPGMIVTTLVGFAVLGFALGPVNPLVGTVAHRLSGTAGGRAIALTQRYVYAGLAIGNLVGPIADVLGARYGAPVALRIAIGTLVLLPLLIIVLAPSMRSARSAQIITG